MWTGVYQKYTLCAMFPDTVCLRMSSGYNSESLSTQVKRGNMKCLWLQHVLNPGSTQQYAMALRPGFGEFESFRVISEGHPEAHCTLGSSDSIDIFI